MTVLGELFRFSWPTLGLEAELSRFVERRDALVAELLIASVGLANGHATRRLLHRSNLNLLAAETRGRLAKDLTERVDSVPWRDVLEQLVFLSIERWREGEPTIDLRAVDPDARSRWFVRPYLEYGGPTVLFAPGGSGKSYLASALAITIASGEPLFGQLCARPGPVLYLDWETDEYTHAERLRALCRGADLPALPPVFYRRMSASLAESLPIVQRELGRLGAVAAIVDSLAAARGGEPESAEVTNQSFSAVRAIRVPTVLVDHVSKASMVTPAMGSAHLTPFGSVFTENRARNTWSVHRSGEEDAQEFAVALVHEKTNNGRRERRHAYTLSFTSALDRQGEERLLAARLRPCDLAGVADFEVRLSLAERIMRHLAAQPDGTTDPSEAATVLGVDRQAVAVRLSDLKRRGRVVYLADRRRYALAAHHQEETG